MAFPSKIDGSAITAAAVGLVEREGEAALTLRRVAALLGVTPNALYRYYSSRDVLVAAAADEVARRLLAAIERAMAAGGKGDIDPAGRVWTLLKVYADFADAHPRLYEIFSTAKSSAAGELPAPLNHDLLWLKVIEIVEPLTGPANAPAATVTLWGLLHGIWSLKQADRLGGKKPDNVNDFAFAALLKGLTPQNS